MLEYFYKIKVETHLDKPISKIESLICTEQLSYVDRLPPKRRLSGKIRTGRNYLRDILRRLEFFWNDRNQMLKAELSYTLE